MRNYVIKGNICYSKSYNELGIVENGYVVCENRQCAGVYEELPKSYEAFPCYDFEGKIVIPGLVDLHVHAPQHSFPNEKTDKNLNDWLNTYTFVEEVKYADIEYAEKAYTVFVENLVNSATTRACVFGTIHSEATLLLMNKLETSGLKTYVGKGNMDRNSPVYLGEEIADKSAEETEKWLIKTKNFENVKPILSPNTPPSCFTSGVTPVKLYLKNDIKAGLGSDVTAGSSLSMFKAMSAAVRCSEMNWRLYDHSVRPLTIEEVFYLATKGGGAFFGNVGSFENGYEFDAVVIDDSSMKGSQKLNIKKRLEQLIFFAEDKNIAAKFVSGKKIFEK